MQRVFALNNEGGLLLCSWPHGGRPVIPFVYSDEVWTGIEYQVAAHLIYEGLVAEGIRIVQTLRNRYAGYNRNPWDEIECGHHYVRAMASWSLLLALSGFTYSVPKGIIGFAPRYAEDDFQCFGLPVPHGDSSVRFWVRLTGVLLEVIHGTLKLNALVLEAFVKVFVGFTWTARKSLRFLVGKTLRFETVITLSRGHGLNVHRKRNRPLVEQGFLLGDQRRLRISAQEWVRYLSLCRPNCIGKALCSGSIG